MTRPADLSAILADLELLGPAGRARLLAEQALATGGTFLAPPPPPHRRAWDTVTISLCGVSVEAADIDEAVAAWAKAARRTRDGLARAAAEADALGHAEALVREIPDRIAADTLAAACDRVLADSRDATLRIRAASLRAIIAEVA